MEIEIDINNDTPIFTQLVNQVKESVTKGLLVNAKENCQVNLKEKGLTIMSDSITNMQALRLTDSEIRIIFSSLMKQSK
jgi:DNA-binding transcriptional regulator YhcF (GntR family)